jgi:GT2 family glycosyltransferase
MIGIILIGYSLYPERLFASVAQRANNPVKWYLFFHGPDEALRQRLAAFSRSTNAHLFSCRGNRGIARSWNDGLLASVRDGNDITMVVNDDVFFYPGGFDKFIEFVRTEQVGTPDYALATPRGYETAGEDAGKTNHQYLGCGAIGPAAIAKVGCFDENFFPAYCEDNDYFRRIRLAGLPYLRDDRVLVEHDRSQTIRSNPALWAELDEALRENQRYFLRKWGGEPQHEAYDHPFANPAFGCLIPSERRHAPYGPGYDRFRPTTS